LKEQKMDSSVEGANKFYTVSQLAELLQLTEMTIYRMAARGDLPHYSIGRMKRFRSDDLERYLADRRVPGSEEPKSDSGLRSRPAKRMAQESAR